MPPKRKNIWEHFTEFPDDPSKVSYNHCKRTISRGKTGSAKSKLATGGMTTHLSAFHKEADAERLQRDAATEMVQLQEQEARRARDESAMAVTTVYGLRSKKLRSDFLDMVSSLR